MAHHKGFGGSCCRTQAGSLASAGAPRPIPCSRVLRLGRPRKCQACCRDTAALRWQTCSGHSRTSAVVKQSPKRLQARAFCRLLCARLVLLSRTGAVAQCKPGVLRLLSSLPGLFPETPTRSAARRRQPGRAPRKAAAQVAEVLRHAARRNAAVGGRLRRCGVPVWHLAIGLLYIILRVVEALVPALAAAARTQSTSGQCGGGVRRRAAASPAVQLRSARLRSARMYGTRTRCQALLASTQAGGAHMRWCSSHSAYP